MPSMIDYMTQLMARRRGYNTDSGAAPIVDTTTPIAPVASVGTPVVPTAPDAAAVARTDALTRARAEAERRAELAIRERGLDPSMYMSMVRNEFDRIQGNIAPTGDPSAAFSDTTVSSLLTGEQNAQRALHVKGVNEKFGPGAENSAIPSSLLDDTINDILTQQRGSASQYLERGKARGIYNDVGYNAGLNAVNSADSVGRSELSSLGGTVIDKYRGLADAVGDKAHSAVSGFQLGQNFSLDPYVQEFEDVRNRATSNAGGDLRSLVGGRNFFDLSKLGQSAGQAQGAVNLRDTDVATALNERRRQNSMNRGLGSQGAF